MIQRIQTIYLALVALAGILMYFFPFVSLVPETANADTVIYHVSALQVELLNNGVSSVFMRYWPMVILNTLIVAFSVYVILMYKTRSKQIKLSHLLLILILAQLTLVVYDVSSLKHVAGEGYMISYNVFSLLPLLQIVCTRLAAAAIRKDEALVRSADRLR